MGSIRTYSGLITKIRAMEARLLKPAQYEEIANLRSVLDIVNYLKEKTSYAKILETLDMKLMHRGDIEKVLILSLYEDYAKIYKFCGLEQRKFLKLYLRHYEVDLINYCLRIVINRYQKPFDLSYKKPFFDHYSQISIEKLMTARTTEQLAEQLQGTIYHKPLSALRDKANVTLFDYDLTLNLFCFSDIWKYRLRIMNQTDKESFIREWGTKIDLLNLQWIYRAKKYYNMKPEDIYSIVIPIQYKISLDLFKQIVEAPNLDDLTNAIHQTTYALHYQANPDVTFEQMYTDILNHVFTANRRKDPYSIAGINAYLFRKEEELQKLTTAMECVRYSLSPGDTLAYVGGKI